MADKIGVRLDGPCFYLGGQLTAPSRLPGRGLPTRPGVITGNAAPVVSGGVLLGPDGQPVDTAGALRKINAELAQEFFEREEIIRVLTVCLLSREHPFILGPPGTSKSALVRALCARVVGAEYFEWMAGDRNAPPEAFLGQIDLKAFEATGDWRRKVAGYLPTAHIAFADEIAKAGPVALTPLLGAMNERLLRNGDLLMHIPLMMMAGASNELFEPELAALWDRFLVRLVVGYLIEDRAFADLMSSAVRAPGQVLPERTTVTLAELQYATNVVVPAVPVPRHVIADLAALRKQLVAECGIVASDRRWKQSVRLLQASAFFAGRSEVDRDDLQVLVHSLWGTEAELPVVRAVIEKYEPPEARRLKELERLFAVTAQGVVALRGQPRQDRARAAAKSRADLEEVRREAIGMGVDNARAVTLVEQCETIMREVMADALRMSPETIDRVLASNR